MEENKLTIEQLRIKGTKIPTLDDSVRFNILCDIADSWATGRKFVGKVSHGSNYRNEEECILIENEGYDGVAHYEIPISEFYRLGMIKEIKYTKQYVINNRVAIKVNSAEEGKQVVKTLGLKFSGDFKIYSYNDFYLAVYYPFDGEINYCSEGHYREKGYEIIDYKTFIEHNKQEKEMKKVIGYKLVKKEYAEAAVQIEGNLKIGLAIKDDQILDSQHAKSVEKLRKAGVLELWFEEVYEEEFKEGSYIYVKNSGFRIGSCKVSIKEGDIKKIKSFNNDTDYTQNIQFTDGSYGGADGNLYTRYLRLATPEEITKATEKVMKIGNFELKVTSEGIFHATEDITKYTESLINSFRNVILNSKFHGCDCHVKEIIFSKTGCRSTETKYSEWENVWTEYNKLKK